MPQPMNAKIDTVCQQLASSKELQLPEASSE